VTRSKAGRGRKRGAIDELPSGALRVRVNAGEDPITGKRHMLVEIIPPGPKSASQAEAARTRLLNQVDERRNPRTNATLDQLLDRHLETLDVGRTTHRMYTRYLEKHVRPFIGRLKAGGVDAEVLDSLYSELRRCRTHCTDRRGTDHRTPREHVCDERCHPHQCKPLAAATIRHIHFLLSGAYSKGVRWRWVGVNPVSQATPPAAPRPDPRPPRPEEVARIVEESWKDPDWGALVWLTMTTGARRGELCALRWSNVDLPTSVLTLRRAISQDGTVSEEKDTKTHQQRRVTLDPETVAVLTEHWDRCRGRAAALGLELSREAFVFSAAVDGSEHLVPGSVSQRYSRLARRLGIETHLHNLRHYSATELIAAGVDVRTVAGRLGHSGGGVTTLRVYAAWLAESDQRAASGLGARMPERPASGLSATDRAIIEPTAPREHLAVELRAQILSGDLPAGAHLPSIKHLAKERDLSPSTVHRAFTLLRKWGLLDGEVGERALRASAPEPRTSSPRTSAATIASPGSPPAPRPPTPAVTNSAPKPPSTRPVGPRCARSGPGRGARGCPPGLGTPRRLGSLLS
jgi:integrase